METRSERDRYVSFCGIQCDANANQFMTQLQHHLQQPGIDQRWQVYFQQKFDQQTRMGHDNLFFIGSQMNNLYAFLESIAAEESLALLWTLEQECC